MTLSGVALLALLWMTPTSVSVRAAGDDFDATTFYKTKCAMCHGLKAEKRFDGAKADDKLVETVLKGKDGSPKMPSYDKAVNAEQAKAIVTYMKSLKQ
jgi:mono/diheme cytochrome c family protein